MPSQEPEWFPDADERTEEEEETVLEELQDLFQTTLDSVAAGHLNQVMINLIGQFPLGGISGSPQLAATQYSFRPPPIFREVPRPPTLPRPDPRRVPFPIPIPTLTSTEEPVEPDDRKRVVTVRDAIEAFIAEYNKGFGISFWVPRWLHRRYQVGVAKAIRRKALPQTKRKRSGRFVDPFKRGRPKKDEERPGIPVQRRT